MDRTWKMYSEILDQEVTLHDPGNGWISATCADGTVYRAEELNILRSVPVEIDLVAHLVKKVFGGTIQSARPYTPQELNQRSKDEAAERNRGIKGEY
jgi:hypothetical protein